MMQPKTPIRYETLDQLIKNNYMLYSRVGFVDYDIDFTQSGQSGYWESYTNNEYLVSQFGDFIILGIQIEFAATQLGGAMENLTIESIFNETAPLYPSALKWLQEPLNLQIRSNYSSPLPKNEELFRNYQRQEEIALIQELRRCNRTAVLLPEFAVAKYKRLVQVGGLRKRLDVSLEQYKRKLLGITFKGFIPRAVRDRIGGLKQAGILNRGESLYGFDFRKEESAEYSEVVAAPLSGNVQIIFVALFAGILFATVVLYVEKYNFYGKFK